ncbi:hypothetical protein RCH06_002953 [Polaromonas sp. CG_9.5]|nr:hypothetical protein [Polaromonas sp. CG_9.5]
MSAPASTLRLLLGDQLNPEHPWFGSVDAGVLAWRTRCAARHAPDI